MRAWKGWKKDITLLAIQRLWATTSYARLLSSNAAPCPSVLTFSKAAILAANAYYNRWQIEVLFQDLKGAFAIEQARVRTFRRLTNLIAIATLAFV